MTRSFWSRLTGSFAMTAAENPTVAMVEGAYRHRGLDSYGLSGSITAAPLEADEAGALVSGASASCAVSRARVAKFQHHPATRELRAFNWRWRLPDSLSKG